MEEASCSHFGATQRRRSSVKSGQSAFSKEAVKEIRFDAETKVTFNVNRVEDAAEMFVVDFEIYFRWDLAAAGGQHLLDGIGTTHRVKVVDKEFFGIFLPIAFFYDAVKVEDLTHVFSVDTQSGKAYAGYNWMVTFRENFELHRFPYDSQQLTMLFETANANMVDWNVSLEVPDGADGGPDQDVRCLLTPESWKLLPDLEVDRSDGVKMSIKLVMQRAPSFYLWNVCFVNFLIVLVSFSVVGIPNGDLADRLSVTLTCMLTSVAFKFVIMQSLPIASYLTFLDKYVLMSFICLGLVTIQCFIARWIDEPHVTSFREAIFFCASCGLWVAVHTLIAVGTYRGWYMESVEDVKAAQRQVQEVFWSRSRHAQEIRWNHSGGADYTLLETGQDAARHATSRPTLSEYFAQKYQGRLQRPT